MLKAFLVAATLICVRHAQAESFDLSDGCFTLEGAQQTSNTSICFKDALVSDVTGPKGLVAIAIDRDEKWCERLVSVDRFSDGVTFEFEATGPTSRQYVTMQGPRSRGHMKSWTYEDGVLIDRNVRFNDRTHQFRQRDVDHFASQECQQEIADR